MSAIKNVQSALSSDIINRKYNNVNHHKTSIKIIINNRLNRSQ